MLCKTNTCSTGARVCSVLYLRSLLNAESLFAHFHIIHIDLHFVVANGPGLIVRQLEVNV